MKYSMSIFRNFLVHLNPIPTVESYVIQLEFTYCLTKPWFL